MTEVTRIAAVVVLAAALLGSTAGEAARSPARVCTPVVSSQWTSTVQGRVTHGRRYRIETERLPCVLARRLAEQLIPLGSSAAFAERRPVGYVCIPLGRGTNRFRPASAVGLCLQKPVASGPERSFSWRPAA